MNKFNEKEVAKIKSLLNFINDFDSHLFQDYRLSIKKLYELIDSFSEINEKIEVFDVIKDKKTEINQNHIDSLVLLHLVHEKIIVCLKYLCESKEKIVSKDFINSLQESVDQKIFLI
ncbi:MAG: hypothetical protein ACD_79C00644G0001 [uncultured bacterium]|nr:MAG: hypothetical protein ACD_79C00644G0001 [uncultured bacterium]